jgi:Flp pilus assembly protein TadG
MTPACARRASERGAALVEFAMILPLLLVVIAGVVDFGLAFQRYEVVTNAAREGARLAVLPGGYTEDQVKARVREYIRVGLGLQNLAQVDPMVPVGNIQVTYPALSPLSQNQNPLFLSTALVTVQYDHEWLLLRPILGLIDKTWGTTITLRASSQMLREPAAGS